MRFAANANLAREDAAAVSMMERTLRRTPDRAWSATARAQLARLGHIRGRVQHLYGFARMCEGLHQY
jgi:hypothetical protein